MNSTTLQHSKKAQKLPAIQFYPGDWRKDPGIQALDYEERGVWFELLLLMHESPRRGYLELNSAKISDEIIAKILKISEKKWQKIRKKLENTGVVSVELETQILFNRRMARDEEIRQKHRESGKLGGNPAFKKGKKNPYYDNQIDNQIDKQQDNQKITPSSSSSSSSSISTSSSDNSVYTPEPDLVNRKPTKIKLGQNGLVFLTQAELDKGIEKFGKEFIDAAIEKLDSWISQEPTSKRKRNGQNAGATFRVWVYNAVAEDQARAARVNGPPKQYKTKTEQNMAEAARLIKKYQKEEGNHDKGTNDEDFNFDFGDISKL